MIVLPRFPGLERNRTQAEREEFVRTIAGAGYDPIGVASVIEFESARTWSPDVRGPKGTFTMSPGYPVGLIQFAPSTAKSLGTSTAALERMTFGEQLRYVVAFYDGHGGPSRFLEPGDYYVAGYGANPRTPDERVLATKGSVEYTKNPSLDFDGDGTITARDLRALTNHRIKSATARGVWLIDENAATVPLLPRLPTPEQSTAVGILALILGSLVIASKLVTRKRRSV